MKVVRKMVSILDQRFQEAEQRFLEVMYGTKKVGVIVALYLCMTEKIYNRIHMSTSTFKKRHTVHQLKTMS